VRETSDELQRLLDVRDKVGYDALKSKLVVEAHFEGDPTRVNLLAALRHKFLEERYPMAQGQHLPRERKVRARE